MTRVNFDELDIDIWGEYYTWRGQPFTGIAFEIHGNGQVKREFEIVDGYESGFIREWYDSGKLKLEGYSKMGEPNTWVKEWFASGALKRSLVAEYHIRVMEQIWDEGGNLIFEYNIPEAKRSRIEMAKKSELRTLKLREMENKRNTTL